MYFTALSQLGSGDGSETHRVKLSSGRGGRLLIINSGHSASLTSLQPWSNYTLVVAASTSVGVGVASEPVVCSTQEGGMEMKLDPVFYSIREGGVGINFAPVSPKFLGIVHVIYISDQIFT